MNDASPRFVAVMSVMSVVLLSATGGASHDQASITQPVIGARAKTVLTVEGRRFKDSNGNGVLDPYEDWRLAVDHRVNDLVAEMTLAEKVGVMLIETLNADCGGTVPQAGVDFITKQQMSHFIFRNQVTATAVCSSTAGRSGQRRPDLVPLPFRVEVLKAERKPVLFSPFTC